MPQGWASGVFWTHGDLCKSVVYFARQEDHQHFMNSFFMAGPWSKKRFRNSLPQEPQRGVYQTRDTALLIISCGAHRWFGNWHLVARSTSCFLSPGSALAMGSTGLAAWSLRCLGSSAALLCWISATICSKSRNTMAKTKSSKMWYVEASQRQTFSIYLKLFFSLWMFLIWGQKVPPNETFFSPKWVQIELVSKGVWCHFPSIFKVCRSSCVCHFMDSL